jgi:hypothetical protein
MPFVEILDRKERQCRMEGTEQLLAGCPYPTERPQRSGTIVDAEHVLRCANVHRLSLLWMTVAASHAEDLFARMPGAMRMMATP